MPSGNIPIVQTTPDPDRPNPPRSGLPKVAAHAQQGNAASMYSYPWPEAPPGLGRRSTDAFEKCSECSRCSWVCYGGVVFCVRCAARRADREAR
jgi:hypothetical protein